MRPWKPNPPGRKRPSGKQSRDWLRQRLKDSRISARLVLGTYPSLDELALTLDEELLRVRKTLPSDHPLLALDRKLDEMSGRENAALWTVEALDSEPWYTVRRIAREALAELE